MLGQGLKPKGYHNIADAMNTSQLTGYLNSISEDVAKKLATMPRHSDFVALYSHSGLSN